VSSTNATDFQIIEEAGESTPDNKPHLNFKCITEYVRRIHPQTRAHLEEIIDQIRKAEDDITKGEMSSAVNRLNSAAYSLDGKEIIKRVYASLDLWNSEKTADQLIIASDLTRRCQK
jgi:hypothetical protein